MRVLPAEISLFSRAWALAGGARLGAGRMLPGKVTTWRMDPLLLALEGESRALGP